MITYLCNFIPYHSFSLLLLNTLEETENLLTGTYYRNISLLYKQAETKIYLTTFIFKKLESKFDTYYEVKVGKLLLNHLIPPDSISKKL